MSININDSQQIDNVMELIENWDEETINVEAENIESFIKKFGTNNDKELFIKFTNSDIDMEELSREVSEKVFIKWVNSWYDDNF